jgi:hypothetical protein
MVFRENLQNFDEDGGQAMRASLKERNIHVELIFRAELI